MKLILETKKNKTKAQQMEIQSKMDFSNSLGRQDVFENAELEC